MREITIVVDAPNRADVLVRRQLPAFSRRQVRELFAAGRVLVNGRLARKGTSVGAGDTLIVELSEAENAERPLTDTTLAIDVLFEDSDLILLDKPAGVPTLPLRIGERGTLANYLATRYPDSPVAGSAFDSGLVHRLDTGTSGVILAARTVEAYRHLRHQFRTLKVGKTYLALVHGDLRASDTIDTPIAHATQTKRMEVQPTARDAARSKARPAVTTFRPVKRFGTATLVAVRIQTGVRHQVRVHLASIRHPIVGDDLYASNACRSAGDAPWTGRPLLHARRLRFTHPADGRVVRIVAPMPADLQGVLARLETSSSARSSP
jgi:23S rRNA pseudouridine1911/1915/1917 synthase